MLVNDFAPQAQAIKGGDLPYRDQRIEYPPLSVPVLIAPIYAGDSTQDFVDGFQWEMLAFDLGIVVLIALALPGEPKRVLSALGIYTAGVVILSGVVLDPSVIDTAPLILARFDLVPALLVLAAVLARDRARSASWSLLISLGAAVKAFPLLLYPALLRGERRMGRVVVAGAIPLASVRWRCSRSGTSSARRSATTRPRPAGGGPRCEPVRDRASARVGGSSDPGTWWLRGRGLRRRVCPLALGGARRRLLPADRLGGMGFASLEPPAGDGAARDPGGVLAGALAAVPALDPADLSLCVRARERRTRCCCWPSC